MQVMANVFGIQMLVYLHRLAKISLVLVLLHLPQLIMIVFHTIIQLPLDAQLLQLQMLTEVIQH